ncbi:hypothetical protein [Streptomyces sp. ISL-98]|uniref:hypothetical protein n=1 Tax=Streptomyces sp. ISL-98 TaxID=2819192 RepID=UPI0027E44771|nr:hypothetical protein [Streptomyces sp. ISL-98]
MTVTESSRSRASGAASLRRSPWAGISTDRLPEKVRWRTLPGSTAAPSAVRATVAPVTLSGEVPYALERRIRASSPAAVTRTTWRTLWREKPSWDQLAVKPVLGSWGEAPQAAVHRASWCGCASAAPRSPKARVAAATGAAIRRTNFATFMTTP